MGCVKQDVLCTKRNISRSHLASEEFSVQSLFEELKPVDTENIWFEFRGKQQNLALLGASWLPGFWCKFQTEWLHNRILPCKCEVFMWDQQGSYQAGKNRGKMFDCQENTILIALFGSFQRLGVQFKHRTKLLESNVAVIG